MCEGETLHFKEREQYGFLLVVLMKVCWRGVEALMNKEGKALGVIDGIHDRERSKRK
jgi:hypothetical protein